MKTDQDIQNVAALSATRLGADPAAMPREEAEATQSQAQSPASPGEQMDVATQQGAPVTDADKQDQPPIKYKIKMGDEDRELTPEQISGTFERYGKLNDFTNAMRPVLSLAAQAMKANPGMTPEKFAQSLIAMANKHNPQMGGQDETPNASGQAKTQDAAEISQQLEQWERDNAASLPPGYKELLASSQGSQAQMSKMMQMMQQVLGRSQGLNDAGQAAAGQAAQQSVSNAKQRIANNLASVQQKLGLPDEAEQDFMMFASERGYTVEDFLDPLLTLKVAQDFKNGMQSGEVARLKAVAQRRQAFTGAAPTQPGGSGTGMAPENARLDQLVDKRLGAR